MASSRRISWTPVHESNCRGASAIDATPARRRGGVNSSPLGRDSTAASSPRNDLVKNCRHPTHWLISTQAEAHLQQSREVAKELEKGSSYELTGAKLEKKEQLLREGFVDWTRKDFRSFLNAMERRGRDEVDVIARETSNETGKTEEEVRRYHKVFWERHKELADWERVIDKIEKGEKRLQRSKEIREALAEKIARCVPAP